MVSKGLLFHVPSQHLRSEESHEIVSAGSSQLTLLCFHWGHAALERFLASQAPEHCRQ